MNELIFLVNDYYDRYELRWYATTSGIDAFSDIMTLGLDLGSAAAGANSIKTILSTISAGVGGTKLALQKDVLQSQNIVLIIRTMRETRRAKYELIRAKMVDSIDVYPLEEGLIDIQEYWHAGTVIGALQKLHNQTSFEAALEAETEAQLERVQRVKELRQILTSEQKNRPSSGKRSASRKAEPSKKVTEPSQTSMPGAGPVAPIKPTDPVNPGESVNPVDPVDPANPVAVDDETIQKAAAQRVALLPVGQAAKILIANGRAAGGSDSSARDRLKVFISEVGGKTLRDLANQIP